MANPDHLDILKQGVKTWNQWRQKHVHIQPDLSNSMLNELYLHRIDLTNADLSGADLRGTDLSNANLAGACFNGANLSRSDLSWSDLSSADLGAWSRDVEHGFKIEACDREGVSCNKVKLIQANLCHTTLTSTNLNGADLTGANLFLAFLYETNLEGAILLDANLSDSRCIRANFQDAQLGKAFFYGTFLQGTDFTRANLSGAHLSGARSLKANFSAANLSQTFLAGTHLEEANLSEANFSGATVSEKDLIEGRQRSLLLRSSTKEGEGAYLRRAILHEADLTGANLSGSDLSNADLSGANLSGANLSEANLSGVNLSETNLNGANLKECRIYAISAWNVHLEHTIQTNLIITHSNEPTITVDNLKIAQFLYLLLNNEEIRDAIDTIARKTVLILGRFTPLRKAVLDALREALRTHGYVPILFDFDKPASRDLTGTISTLAHLARFIIVDLTDPSSAPHEVATVIPQTVVPVQPVILDSEREYSMFRDLRRRYDWVLSTYSYTDLNHLLATLQERVIAPAEQKAQELEKR